MLAAAVEHDLARAAPDDQQDQADGIDPLLFDLGLGASQQKHGAAGADDRDRNVDEEDPVPTPIVADRAAKNRAEDRSDDGGHRPDSGCLRMLLLGENAEQESLADRHEWA